MKATLRIPTLDQYAYVEIELEDPTPETVVSMYNEYSTAVKGGTGLDQKDFNRVLDGYLTEKTMQVHEYEEMNLDQQQIIQSIKRSFARTK